jgi:thiosulfate/3-mercaptopyruvate sulfurtransferase
MKTLLSPHNCRRLSPLLLRLYVSTSYVHGLSILGGSSTPTTANTRISIAEAMQSFDTLTFVDASWYHKGDRNGREEYRHGPRIANAVFFDWIQLCHFDTPPTQCAAMMDGLGITNDSNIVLYGQPRAFFLPRAWFTIRHVMGHEAASCRLLDGTMADWEAAGGPMEYDDTMKQDDIRKATTTLLGNPVVATSYQPRFNSNVVIGLEDMKQFVRENRGVILDARGSSFQKGHMPGAIHIPYSSLQDDQGRLLSIPEMATTIRSKVLLDPTADVVVTCGSGVSACTIFLALQELNHVGRVRVYDGGWSEWKTHDELPKVIPQYG